MEGAEVFSFGGSGRGWGYGGYSSDMSLFYSRRLGLAGGLEARIVGGAKMVGKIGAYHLGLMDIYTDEVVFEEDDGTEMYIPGSNFSVFRLSRDVLSRGSIGMMVLNKQDIGARFNPEMGFNRRTDPTDPY